MRKAKKIVKGLACVIAASLVIGFAVMYLWNWLMPAIFGLRTVTFWQALGLFVLGKILLGGFHRHNKCGDSRWNRRMKDRWEQMSPEERERFRAGMRERHFGRFEHHQER